MGSPTCCCDLWGKGESHGSGSHSTWAGCPERPGQAQVCPARTHMVCLQIYLHNTDAMHRHTPSGTAGVRTHPHAVRTIFVAGWMGPPGPFRRGPGWPLSGLDWQGRGWALGCECPGLSESLRHPEGPPPVWGTSFRSSPSLLPGLDLSWPEEQRAAPREPVKGQRARVLSVSHGRPPGSGSLAPPGGPPHHRVPGPHHRTGTPPHPSPWAPGPGGALVGTVETKPQGTGQTPGLTPQGPTSPSPLPTAGWPAVQGGH